MMSTFPASVPRPEPADRDEALFWQACAEKRLCVQRCADCSCFRHPPVPICPACRSADTAWTEVAGTGTVFSYTVAHHAVHPSLKDSVPYIIALVHLDGAGDVRLVTNLIDCAPEDVAIGMRVRLVWEALGEDGFIPRFRMSET